MNEVRHKMLNYKHLRATLNEQAMHFEIMLNRMNPDILRERMALMRDDDKDELLGDDTNVFNRILKHKGILKDDNLVQ